MWWAAIKSQVVWQWVTPKQVNGFAYPIPPDVVFIQVDALGELAFQFGQLVLITLPGKHRVL